ncbi:ankyrin repeat domain-containing protein [Paenibacillus terrae]|uniref:ankyrin repeat domain-containing protein n=1 Tax=Paenibacillus terrae TaxID=159743 RepID=UPI0010BF32E5|nr:ankyrin repeat domain-containing protein [Paenibacillus terrae]
MSHQARTAIQDSDGHTCLHMAAYHHDQPEIIRLLMEQPLERGFIQKTARSPR